MISRIRIKRKLWVWFVYLFLIIRYYTWYKILDFYDWVKFKTHRLRYNIGYVFRNSPFLDNYVRRDVYSVAITLVRYIRKYIENENDISDLKFINHIDKKMSVLYQKVMRRGLEYTPYLAFTDVKHWAQLATMDTEELIEDNKTDKLSLFNNFFHRLEYLSDRLGSDRFIHLLLLWFYARSRLLYIPCADGKYNHDKNCFEKDIITQWEDR